MAEVDPFKNYKPDLFPRISRAIAFVTGRSQLQLCTSDHYERTHFTDEPVQPAQGLPPAERWDG